ncbi:MAG: hypothetical protein H6602_13090 [Flavobacteriales bacterium]|nr:hypothetical protein [Flavobacteriales bacterium]
MAKQQQNKWLILALILSAAIYSVFFLAKPINLTTADLGRHIVNGELLVNGITDVLYRNFYSYTEPDHSFTNHHWLTGVTFYFVHGLAGFDGLSILYMMLVLGALAAIVTASKNGDRWVIPILVTLSVVQMISYRVEIRPEGFSYLLAGLFYLILKKISATEGKSFLLIGALLLLQLIWVNLHILFFLGIAITGVFLVDALINKTDKIKTYGLLVVALTAISLVNPHHVKGLLAPLTIFNEYGYMVAENQPIWFMHKRFGDAQLYHFELFGILALVLIGLQIRSGVWKFQLKEILLVLAFGLLSMMAVRGIPLFALFFIPFASSFISNRIENLNFSTRQSVINFLPIVGIVFSVLFLALPKTYASARKGYEAIGLIENINLTGEFLRKQEIPGPIFNNYDVGGYLIYHLHDREKLFVDNRPEAYSVAFFDSIYKPMQKDDTLWEELSEKYGFNVICFFRHDNTPWAQPFLIRRTQDPEWVPIFVDQACLVLIKNRESNRKWIQRFGIDRSVFKSVPN